MSLSDIFELPAGSKHACFVYEQSLPVHLVQSTTTKGPPCGAFLMRASRCALDAGRDLVILLPAAWTASADETKTLKRLVFKKPTPPGPCSQDHKPLLQLLAQVDIQAAAARAAATRNAAAAAAGVGRLAPRGWMLATDVTPLPEDVLPTVLRVARQHGVSEVLLMADGHKEYAAARKALSLFMGLPLKIAQGGAAGDAAAAGAAAGAAAASPELSAPVPRLLESLAEAAGALGAVLLGDDAVKESTAARRALEKAGGLWAEARVRDFRISKFTGKGQEAQHEELLADALATFEAHHGFVAQWVGAVENRLSECKQNVERLVQLSGAEPPKGATHPSAHSAIYDARALLSALPKFALEVRHKLRAKTGAAEEEATAGVRPGTMVRYQDPDSKSPPKGVRGVVLFEDADSDWYVLYEDGVSEYLAPERASSQQIRKKRTAPAPAQPSGKRGKKARGGAGAR